MSEYLSFTNSGVSSTADGAILIWSDPVSPKVAFVSTGKADVLLCGLSAWSKMLKWLCLILCGSLK